MKIGPYKKRLLLLLAGCLTCFVAQAQVMGSIDLIAKYLNNRLYLRVADRLLETGELLEFYKLRNNNLIWFANSQLSSQAESLRTALSELQQHGLNNEEYWTPMLESSLQAFRSAPSETAMMRVELLMTDSLLRAANHLANGRFDPAQIDNDIRFRKKPFLFTDLFTLINGLAGSAEGLSLALQSLAPQHREYRQLLSILAELRDIKINKKSYLRLTFPGLTLKPKDINPLVGKLKQALADRGYISETNQADDSNLYSSQLENAVTAYQSENGLEVGSFLQARSEFWRTLSFSIEQRIKQTEVNLEKLRWLPRNLENRYIFVNLAFSEFSLFEHSALVMEMKTVNGRPLWRSPSMRDTITSVIFNPTWTATDSIVTQLKLPEILKDPSYLDKLRIKLYDRSSGKIVPIDSVDWKNEGVNIVKRVLFVQDPGPENALGVVKFPLTNLDDIYMHDTNEKFYFNKGMRQRSSGCIRLEKPLDLAAYLLKGSIYTPAKIQEIIAKGIVDEVYQTQMRINLAKESWLPIYTLYQTVSRGANGRIRFATDYYGQDQRVALAVLQNTNKRDDL